MEVTLSQGSLLARFRSFARCETAQIGRYFCIPATLANAFRLLGYNSLTQQWIRDVHYQGRTPEPDINDQMKGISFGLVEELRRHCDFPPQIRTEIFGQPGDNDIFDYRKAEHAVDFVCRHVSQNHPVIVSTWQIMWEQGILTPFCCHMWLVLDYDPTRKNVTVHDPAINQLLDVPLRIEVPLIVNSQRRWLDCGLRGKITHTDYNCLTIWNA